MRESSVAEGELSDEALLAGMAVGDQEAAVAFTRRYQRRVFGLAYSMTSDAGVAEDVAQEAMILARRRMRPSSTPGKRLGDILGPHDHHRNSGH